jgi:hypothetical protein
MTKSRAYEGVGQEWSLTITFHVLGSVGRCEGMNPHTPKWSPTLGVGVPMDFQILKGSTFIGLKKFLITLESSWNIDVWNGFTIPFEYLKHKLWLKVGPRVKLPIWLLTIKTWELPWNKCVQVTYDILLESSQQKLQLCFRPHFNERSSQKLWASKVVKIPISSISRLPTWESWDKMTFGCKPCGRHREYYKGEGGGVPQVWAWWVLWVRACPWLVHAPKMLQR